MDNIKNVINDVVKNLSQKKPTEQQAISGIWNRALSETDRKHTQLHQIKDGKLTVLVDSPAWLYQLKTKKQTLLKKIQEETSKVKDIVFKIGKLS